MLLEHTLEHLLHCGHILSGDVSLEKKTTDSSNSHYWLIASQLVVAFLDCPLFYVGILSQSCMALTHAAITTLISYVENSVVSRKHCFSVAITAPVSCSLSF